MLTSSKSISSNGQSTVSRFYKQVGDFKDRIIKILRQLKDQQLVDHHGQAIDVNEEIKVINKYYDKLMMAKTANARLPIEALYEYGIVPYAEPILLRDEQFFLGGVDDYIEDPSVAPAVEVDPKDMMFIRQVRLIWDYLDQIEGNAVKSNIWAYVQIICLLAEQVLSEKDYTRNTLATTKQALIESGRLS